MKQAPDIVFRKEMTHPRDGKHPGFGHRESRDGDMLIERDVAVAMRDGIKIYADILRPAGDRKVPAIVTFSPYGKHGFKDLSVFPGTHGVPPGAFSKYTIWEGPDPLYWVPHGYAIVNADARGSWYSEGDLTLWSEQEGEDGYDLIEWVAAQPWCSGKVGTTGVSYLALVQWRVASTNPPHLAAINPWEGWSDAYRDRCYHGGIPETNFVPWAQWSTSFGLGRGEEVIEVAAQHPLLDDYWQSKLPPLEAIRAPAYVVGSWSLHGLHSRGTLEGFRRIGSKHKWLDAHGRKEWQYCYQPDNVERLRVFFDHFLKGTSDEVLSWPQVRIEVRDRFYVGEVRNEQEWPLARTQATPLYLDAASGTAQPGLPAAEHEVRYDPCAVTPAAADSSASGARAVFDIKFTADTEITGYAKLKLWIEADGADDADLFVALQKFDRDGNYVPFPFFATFENGPVALGWLRVSHRALDRDRSTPLQPWHSHTAEQKLAPGEIVPVEIEIWPSSTVFHAGEILRILIQGSDVYTYPGIRSSQLHQRSVNRGTHIIHTGGRYDTHLLVPIIPSGR